MKSYRARCLSVLVFACFTGSVAARGQVGDFDIPTSLTDKLRRIEFWGTNYWVHEAQEASDGIPLLDLKERPLGITLSRKDWCFGALEGTVRIGAKTFNFAGTGKTKQVDCSTFFTPEVGFSRFTPARGPLGDGIQGFVLVPYRTLATDPSFLSPGTVVYIPAAVGSRLPGGKSHDGYFFVGDRGGAVKGNHIDFFNGEELSSFPFVLSRPKPLFVAYVIENTAIIQKLTREHTRSKLAVQ
jgi:3D (Asp-Asp-Asp) domain-containing protein